MTSDRDRWQRARALFDELVAMEPGLRRARLAQVGAIDPLLGAEVERLLLADSAAEAALSPYHFGSADTGADPTSRDPLNIVGRTISHYRIDSFVAAGGMGVVYRAEDLTLGRAVALKFPLPQQHMESAVKERFLNEARSAATISHPAVCAIHEIGESGHGVFLAMPLYAGETLKDKLAREGRLEFALALDIAYQVTSGVAAAHEAGIIHRDLKPGNVMLLPDGTVKVLDFGLAKIRDVDLTRSKGVIGTIGYVAPEQLRGERPAAGVDLWAIGVILHEMLTGKAPFARDHELSVMHAILHEEPPRPSEVNRELPAGADALAGALLQKSPGDRYHSAAALLGDLVALQRGAPVVLQTPFWSRTPARRRTRRRVVPLTAVAMVVVAGLAWNIRSGPNAPADAAGAVLHWDGDVAEIGTAAELELAVDPANAGRRIRMRAGVYELTQPIVVPDGMTLEGAGVMGIDADGRPIDFEDDARTTLRMTTNVGGDLLTLGDGATLRNLEIVDLAGRSGNVVAVVSRGPGDSVSATIIESIIVNPNPLVIGAGGALGRGLLVVTLNPNMAAEPAAHERAVLVVQVLRSVIRSPSGGGGLFAYNFAARSRIEIDMSQSVMGGSSEMNGGVSRPDAVHDSEVHITSRGNLYRNDWADPCLSPLLGWNLTGGSAAPIPIAVPATTRNRLLVESVDDRIEGFTTAVVATGSRRFFDQPLNAAPTDNRIDLLLTGTVVTAPTCDAVGRTARTSGTVSVRPRASGDFLLTGAWVENDVLEAGDRNIVRVEFRNVTGSGTRTNQYAHAGGLSGPLPARLQGIGNRLEVVGDPAAFDVQNRGIDPRPPAGFFTGRRAGTPPGP